MKILIWGTGAIAKQLLEDDIYEVLKDAIVAFVDSDVRKIGGEFMGKRIVSPTQIKEFEYDKICVLNSYIEEIKKQANNELQLDDGELVGNEAFEDVVRQVLVENYDIQTKRCLMIGDEKIYSRQKTINENLFNMVGFVAVNHLESVKEYQYDYILLMDPMYMECMDKRKGRSILEMEIKQKLIESYGVMKPIFTRKIWGNVHLGISCVTWGEENPDKKFWVCIYSEGVGLGAYVNSVDGWVHYALAKGYIPVVDMMTYKNQYLTIEEVGRVNAWEKFFEQPSGYSLSDVKNSKNVIISMGGPRFDKYGGELSFLKEKPYLIKKREEFIEKYMWNQKKILGVLVRGTDYANCRPYAHSIQPELDVMIEKVKEVMKCWDAYDYVYVCTEVQEYIERFQEEFGDKVIFYPQRRIRADYSELLCECRFDRKDDEFYRGADYWIALKLLANCNALVGGNCGGAIIAQKLNANKYEHKYIFDLGRYGIDDIE